MIGFNSEKLLESVFRVWIFIMVAVAMCLVVSAFASDNREALGTTTAYEKKDDNIVIFTDPETKVQYIIYRETLANEEGIGGITPRYNADGSFCIAEDSE